MSRRTLPLPVPLPAQRPSMSDEWVLHCVAGEIYRRLCEDMPGDFKEDDSERESTISQLEDAVGFWTDGYQIARTLDQRFGWEVDSQMVDLFDEAGSIACEAVDQATLAWVEATKPVAPYPPGTRLLVRGRGGVEAVGYIVDDAAEDARENARPARAGETRFQSRSAQRNAARAEYLVRVPDFGHVETGQGTRGQMVPWEEARLAPDVPQEGSP